MSRRVCTHIPPVILSPSALIELLFGVVLILAFNSPLLAQQSIEVNSVRATQGRVRLGFNLDCDQSRIVHAAQKDVRLHEDGLPVTRFALQCPDSANTPVCAILVFAPSESLTYEEYTGVKDAGKALVDLMDDDKDRAGIVSWVNGLPSVRPLTSSTQTLRTGMSDLRMSGDTPMWDICFIALQLFEQVPDTVYRSLVVFTNGPDNTSSFASTAILNEAQRLGVHINSVHLTTGWNSLSHVCAQTGGLSFFTDGPDNLRQYSLDMFREMRNAYGEFLLTWDKLTCDDGQEHEARLRMAIPCSSSYTASALFRAPLDTSAFQHLALHLGSASTQAGRDASIELRTATPIDSTMLHSFSFRLRYDTSRLHLQRIEALPGTLLHGMLLTHHEDGEGAVVSADGRMILAGEGTLVELTFSTAVSQDTLLQTVRASDWIFDAGCLDAAASSGKIGIYPPGPYPLVACEIFAPEVLPWERNRRDYAQNPFAVTARFINDGGVTARNARFAIDYDHALLQRVQPAEDTISYASADITPGSHAAVSWDLRTPRLLQDDTTIVTITGMFDNHPPVTCTARIIIPRADAVLECSIHTPRFWSDPGRGLFGPMPFPVSVTIHNTGGRPAEHVVAGIALSDSLALAGADAPDKFQKAPSPSTLNPGDSVRVEWMLQHPTVRRPQSPELQVIVQSPSTAATSCNAAVEIPGIDLGPFFFTLLRSGSTVLCAGDSVVLDASSGRDSWLWNTGDGKQRIVVRESGMYFCTVRLGKRTGYSDTVHVAVRPEPAPRLRIEGSLPLCAGDTLLLDAGEGYARYAWNTGSAQRHIEVNVPGDFWVRVTDDAGCAGESDTVRVAVLPPPLLPRITRTGDILYADSAGSLQWYCDGQPISGATNRSVALNRTGGYTVLVTDTNGCTAESDVFDVDILAVDALPSFVRAFDVFPNPTAGVVEFRLALRSRERVQYSVTDMLGRVLARGELPAARELLQRIDLTDFPPGSYVLRICVGSTQLSRMVVLR